MMSAKDMFKELGYKKVRNDNGDTMIGLDNLK